MSAGKFKDDAGSGWLGHRELDFLGAFIRNFDKKVDESDFFLPFERFDRDSTERMIRLLGGFSKKDWKRAGYKFEEGHNSPSLRGWGELRSAMMNLWNAAELRKPLCKCMRSWLDETRQTIEDSGGDLLKTRMDEVCELLRLDDAERAIAEFSLVRALGTFQYFPENRPEWQTPVFFAMAADCPASEAVRILSPRGKLRRFGLLDNDLDLERENGAGAYLASGGNSLQSIFYEKVSTDEALPWDYFGELAEKHGELVKEMIVAAGGKRAVHLLLHGVPGTGKTSFAKSLARELGLSLFEISHGDVEREHVSVHSRLAGLEICNTQLPPGNSLVLVDEADGLLRSNAREIFFNSGCVDKGVLNEIIDKSRVSTIWISNAPVAEIDPSTRRRFDYSIAFRPLTKTQRRKIWENCVEKLDCKGLFTPQALDEFAGKWSVAAGGISKILRNVRDMTSSESEAVSLVERLMAPHCRLLGADLPKEENIEDNYSLEGLNIKGETPLAEISAAVQRYIAGGGAKAGPRMNILLWGPPGTGKSEYAKHLAREAGVPLSVKMGSDLISKWVGETERNIAQAFRDAEEEGAILFLDEIDGLLQSRAGASHSWEITQVNELLHAMENFNGVMIGATNFMKNLDGAVMRRFTFKLQFDWLDKAGKREFFKRMFASRLNAGETLRLDAIPRLAPGDFRTVRDALHWLGADVGNERRLAELEKESAMKTDGLSAATAIGF